MNILIEKPMIDYAEFILEKLVQAIENEADETRKNELDAIYKDLRESLQLVLGIEKYIPALQQSLVGAQNLLFSYANNPDMVNEVQNDTELEAGETNEEMITEVPEASEVNEEPQVEEEQVEEAVEEQEIQPAIQLPTEEAPVAEEEENTAEQEAQESSEVPETKEEVTDVENKEEIQFVRTDDNIVDRGFSATPDQKVNLSASFDTQEALIKTVGSQKEAPTAETTAEVPAEAATPAPEATEAAPATAEAPTTETASTEEVSPEELEQMMNQLTEAMANGDPKAEEISAKISEANSKSKQLVKE